MSCVCPECKDPFYGGKCLYERAETAERERDQALADLKVACSDLKALLDSQAAHDLANLILETERDKLLTALLAETVCQTCEGTGIMGGNCEQCAAVGYRSRNCGLCGGKGSWESECVECNGQTRSFRSDEAKAVLSSLMGTPALGSSS